MGMQGIMQASPVSPQRLSNTSSPSLYTCSLAHASRPPAPSPAPGHWRGAGRQHGQQHLTSFGTQPPFRLRQAIGEELVDSIVTDNIPIFTEEEKYNAAVLSSVERIEAKLSNKAVPGARCAARKRLGLGLCASCPGLACLLAKGARPAARCTDLHMCALSSCSMQ